MVDTIIAAVISYIIGIFVGKPHWQKGIAAAKEGIEAVQTIIDAVKEDSPEGVNITPEEWAKIKKEVADIVNVFKKP